MLGHNEEINGRFLNKLKNAIETYEKESSGYLLKRNLERTAQIAIAYKIIAMREAGAIDDEMAKRFVFILQDSIKVKHRRNGFGSLLKYKLWQLVPNVNQEDVYVSTSPKSNLKSTNISDDLFDEIERSSSISSDRRELAEKRAYARFYRKLGRINASLNEYRLPSRKNNFLNALKEIKNFVLYSFNAFRNQFTMSKLKTSGKEIFVSINDEVKNHYLLNDVKSIYQSVLSNKVRESKQQEYFVEERMISSLPKDVADKSARIKEGNLVDDQLLMSTAAFSLISQLKQDCRKLILRECNMETLSQFIDNMSVILKPLVESKLHTKANLSKFTKAYSSLVSEQKRLTSQYVALKNEAIVPAQKVFKEVVEKGFNGYNLMIGNNQLTDIIALLKSISELQSSREKANLLYELNKPLVESNKSLIETISDLANKATDLKEELISIISLGADLIIEREAIDRASVKTNDLLAKKLKELVNQLFNALVKQLYDEKFSFETTKIKDLPASPIKKNALNIVHARCLTHAIECSKTEIKSIFKGICTLNVKVEELGVNPDKIITDQYEAKCKVLPLYPQVFSLESLNKMLSKLSNPLKAKANSVLRSGIFDGDIKIIEFNKDGLCVINEMPDAINYKLDQLNEPQATTNYAKQEITERGGEIEAIIGRIEESTTNHTVEANTSGTPPKQKRFLSRIFRQVSQEASLCEDHLNATSSLQVGGMKTAALFLKGMGSDLGTTNPFC